jgi:CheY-like chemotaxis protein
VPLPAPAWGPEQGHRRSTRGAHPLPPAGRPPERGRLHTALLLEPSTIQRRSVRHALLGAGVQRVLEVDSAADALRVLSAELVELVLTPWEGMEPAGRPLLTALRNRGRNRNVPIIVLDPGLTPQQVVATVKAGAAGRLALPASTPAVRALLERLAAETGAADDEAAFAARRVARSVRRRPER